MNNIDDLLGLEDDGRPVTARSKKARTNLGDLHALLTEKLPHLNDPQSGVCNLHKLARLRGLTFQGVYKWFRERHNNQLPYGQAEWLVEVSQKFADSGNAPAGFKAMTFEEIRPYISTKS